MLDSRVDLWRCWLPELQNKTQLCSHHRHRGADWSKAPGPVHLHIQTRNRNQNIL